MCLSFIFDCSVLINAEGFEMQKVSFAHEIEGKRMLLLTVQFKALVALL